MNETYDSDVKSKKRSEQRSNNNAEQVYYQ